MYKIKKALMEEISEPDTTVVCAFGRMNPPTIGHLKLITKMEQLAAQRSNIPAKLYLSHSNDPKKNPLDYNSKIEWAKKMFGNKVDVIKSEAINMFYMLHELYNQGFKHVIYICGEDRIEGTEKSVVSANGQTTDKRGKSLLDTTYFNFETITFENAGNRDVHSLDPTERASASLAREYAQQGDLKSFISIVPLSEDDAILLFDEVQTGMGL